MLIKVTTGQFIAKAREVHNDLYSYELVEYINNKTKVKIVCKQHGSFEQSPNSHLASRGCPICGNEAKAAKAKSEFASKSNLIHNDKYSYELVDYTNNYTKVKILCKSHGEFL